MLGVEQTGSDRVVSTFHTEEQNLVEKIDQLNFSPFSESSVDTSGKNCTVYTVQKKDICCKIVPRNLRKKLQLVALTFEVHSLKFYDSVTISLKSSVIEIKM